MVLQMEGRRKFLAIRGGIVSKIKPHDLRIFKSDQQHHRNNSNKLFSIEIYFDDKSDHFIVVSYECKCLCDYLILYVCKRRRTFPVLVSQFSEVSLWRERYFGIRFKCKSMTKSHELETSLCRSAEPFANRENWPFFSLLSAFENALALKPATTFSTRANVGLQYKLAKFCTSRTNFRPPNWTQFKIIIKFHSDIDTISQSSRRTDSLQTLAKGKYYISTEI